MANLMLSTYQQQLLEELRLLKYLVYVYVCVKKRKLIFAGNGSQTRYFVQLATNQYLSVDFYPFAVNIFASNILS